MAISQLQFGVCLDCSSNKYSVTDTSSGSPTDPITAETFTITYPSDDSVTIDLFSNNGDSLEGNIMNISSLQSTSVDVSFIPPFFGSTDYELYIIYTDSNGILTYVGITVTSSLPGDYPGTAALIIAAINAQSSITGVTASYDVRFQNIVTLSGSGFSVAATTIENTQIAFGRRNLIVQNVSSPLITDGKHTFSWNLTDDDATYNASSESYFLCNVECCVRGKMSAIDIDCDCTGDKATDAAIESMLMLQGIKAAAACGKDAKADKLLVGLQAICNNDCKSC
jgi:hypothetical protein